MIDHSESGPPATGSMPSKKEAGGGESMVTVIVALVANALIAVAKSAAALITGSASMMAEAAHSWADTGNEIFLLLADRAGRRPRDAEHPRGYGRASYVWSLVAAFGLFSAGAVVSIWHGLTELTHAAPETSFTINYIVLGIAFLLEGTSFLQASRQVRGQARSWGMHPLAFVDTTSDPTVRAVFSEDSAALLGLLLAGAGVGLHQLTGNPLYDAIGSIAVGVLLGFVAVFLMRRNMQYLLGLQLSPVLRRRILDAMLAHDAVDRITYLHVEYVGPQKLFVVAAVDLTGDDREPDLARRLRKLEAELEDEEMIEDAVLTLSTPEEESLTP